jgi:fructokinase
MSPKLLCIGEALIDMICTDKGMPLSQGENFVKKAGGAPANVAAAVAALGGKVDMCAKVGTDPFGQFLMDMLRDMGVGTDYVFRDSSHFTTFAFVSLMQNGERDFYFNRGADGHLLEQDVNELPLADYSIVHFGSATAFLPGPLQDSYFYLLELCKARGIYVSFDPNYRSLLFGHQQEVFIQQSWRLLQHCNFCKMSDEEALLISGAESVGKAMDLFMNKTSAAVAITLGPEGTLLCLKGEKVKVESIPVEPVDTTGAGDAFVGAVLYQLMHYGHDERTNLGIEQWKRMTTNANKAGARTCAYIGAMEAFCHLSTSIFE